MTEYIQRGPSCDLDARGDPKPPKYVRVDGWVNDDNNRTPSIRQLRRKAKERKTRVRP